MAVVVAVVMVISGASYLLYHPPGPSNVTSEGTTILPNGTVVYSYPTANLSPSISVQVDQVFVVQLSSNAGSTGYDWNVSSSGGIEFLNYTVVSTSNLAGGAQARDYYFRATQPGSQSITFQYTRRFSPYDTVATIGILATVIGPLLLSYNF
ncbi:MAG: protease inhibitor I42 family protein [Nitrososphaerota archaeon]|nr:protease inhibitor I42 family protein [Nitrososphaerota archaeon]MDG6973377.1 protease inhibitor I42 family protein [Nitrososphaerota archaeon]MDG6975427.1 protease inhibitor I42 family protein [Nitrososphaerota archaeon]